jgi:hypothetical protein
MERFTISQTASDSDFSRGCPAYLRDIQELKPQVLRGLPKCLSHVELVSVTTPMVLL